MRRKLCVLIAAACCIGCSNRAAPNVAPAAPGEALVSPRFDRLDVFVRNAAREAVELTLTRDARGTTILLVRPDYDERQRAWRRSGTVLDSIGPAEQGTDVNVRMLHSFDIWGLNAPDAPGGACRTVMGQRSCSITLNDYSLVMRVQRGREVRAQRYTGLEKSTSNGSARALADFIFTWARKREGRGQHP